MNFDTFEEGYTCVLAPKAKGWLIVDRYGDECGEPQFSSHAAARQRADELNDDVIARRFHGLR